MDVMKGKVGIPRGFFGGLEGGVVEEERLELVVELSEMG